ncbi:MAG: hypothetical protein N2442_09020 [Spirochaetes bacterium]|nr:hypothetical protein [Spirochaetota bacterium]
MVVRRLWYIWVVLLFWGLVRIQSWDRSTLWQERSKISRQEFLVFMTATERSENPALWGQSLEKVLSMQPEWERTSLLAEYEQRFSRWIQQEWERNVPKAPLEDLVREVAWANHTYTLRTDETGRTLFDDKGDPLFKGMDGFESDEMAWKGQVETKREALLSKWEHQARIECQELLSSFSPNLKDLAETHLSVCLAEYKKGIEREFDRLVQQGTTRFLQGRLQDNFSLRRKSEGTTAEAVAVSLLTKTEEDLRTVTQRLIGELPKGKEGSIEIHLDSTQWQEEFKREFAQGMATWKRVEERFLQERLLWEEKAQASYLESEKAWERSFEEFGKRRETWLKEMRSLLEIGRNAWKEQEDSFLKEYKRELEIVGFSVDSELGKFKQEAESQLSIYKKSLELVEMAEENGNLIQDELNRLSVRVDSLNNEIAMFQSEVSLKESKIESILLQLPTKFRSCTDADAVDYTILEYDWDTRRWYGAFIEFLERSGYELIWLSGSDGSDYPFYEPAVKGGIPWAAVRLFNEGVHQEELSSLRMEICALQDRELNPRIAERDEIQHQKIPPLQQDLFYWMGSGGIRDRFEATRMEAVRSLYDLAFEASRYGSNQVKDSPLDREIDRVRQVLSLEEKQLAIVQEVFTYAQDSSSNRPTDSQTARSLEQAQERFSKAEEEYRNALHLLERHLSITIGAAQQEASRAKEEMTKALNALKEVQKAYEEALSVYRSGSITLLSTLIDEYGRNISTYYGDGEGSRKGAWERYIAGMEYIHRQEVFQQATQIIRDLEGEGDFDEFPDLEVLRQRVEVLKDLFVPWDSGIDPSTFALQLTMEGVSKEKVETIQELYRLGIEGNALARWKAEAVLEGVKQEASLSLFQAEQIRQFLLLDPFCAEEGAEYLKELSKNEKDAEASYWVSRLRKEKEAISFILDADSGVGWEAKELSLLIRSYGGCTYQGDRNRLQELEQILELVKEKGYLDVEILKEVGSRSPFSWEGAEAEGVGIEAYRPDGTGVYGTGLHGIDLVELFCGREWLDWEKAHIQSEIARGYAHLSRVLAKYERKELSDRIQEAIKGVDFSSRNGLTAFLLSLPNHERLPSYLIEALSRVTALSIFIHGQDPFSLVQDMVNSFNESGSLDRSGIDYLEDTKEAAKSLSLGETVHGCSLPTRSIMGDLSAYRNILQIALRVFAQEWSIQALTMEEARFRREVALGGEREILNWEHAYARLMDEIKILQEGRERYREQVLDRKREELNQASRFAEESRLRYADALKTCAEDSKVYEALLSDANDAKARYTEARYDRDRAEAIYQYASAGYVLPGFTPEELLAERTNRVEELRWVLKKLNDLHTLGQDPFAERMDPTYRAAMVQEQTWMECIQYLTKAKEAIQKESASLQRKILQVVSSMDYQIRKVFEFRQYRESEGEDPLSFIVDPRYEASHFFMDLRTEDEALFAQRVNEYFGCESLEVSQRLSTDVVNWIKRVVSQGNTKELLRQFGLAYYYDTIVQGDLQIEGAPPIVSSLLQDPSWNKLIEDYVDLGPVSIPIYEYSGDDAMQVGYEIYYPEYRWTVEDYIASKTREFYQGIRTNGELWPLYSFYKMMMATHNMKVGTTYIGKDLGDLVFSHVDTLAEKKQKSYLKWWKFWTHAEGRRIRALRQDIDQVHDTGQGEREDLAQRMEAIVSLEMERSSQQALLNHITSHGQDLTLDRFLALLEEKAGSPVDPTLGRTIAELFQTVDVGQKQETRSFLEAVQQGILFRIQYSQKVTHDRAIQLSNERNAIYDRFRTLLEQVRTGNIPGSRAREELENLLESLFGNPSFSWDDHYAASLQLVETVKAPTRAGWTIKLEEITERALAMFQGRMETIQDQERFQAQREFSLLKEKQQQWESQMETLFRTGTAQWKEHSVRLYGMRKRWQEEYAAEFEARKRLWEGKYALLVQNRKEWVELLCREAVAAAIEGMGKLYGIERSRLLSEIDQVRIPDLSFETYGTPQDTLCRIVQDAFGGQGMDTVLMQAGWITSRIGKEKPILTAFLPRLRDTSEALKQAERFAEGIGDEIYRKASLVAALKMGKIVEDAQTDVKEKILEANQRVERNVTDTLRGAGYQRDGKLFIRRAVIDETLLGGIERETQKIEGYRYFQAPYFHGKVDLSRGALEGRSGDHIQAMVKMAQGELSRYLELIFGRKGNASWSWEGVENLKELFLEAEQRYQSSGGYERKGLDGTLLNQSDGLFHWHVGFVPLMDPGNPEVVKEEGYGEMGRIFALFFRNQARQQRGLASFDVAWYSRKLWDDDRDNDGKSDGVLSSPTIRSLTNLAVSIASTTCMSPWAASALNLVDDALFTAMDAGNWRIRWGEGMQNLAKQAGLDVLTMGIGLSGSSLDRALDFGKGFEGALLEVGSDLGIASMKTIAQSYGTGTMEALWAGKTKVNLDWNDVGSTLGVELVRTGVQSGLQATLRGYVGQTLSHGNSLNALVGNLSANATEYALKGTTQFNLINARMFGEDVSGGLLEFTLGGKGGPCFGLGQGGTDISLGILTQGLKGVDAYYQNFRMVKEGIRDDLATAMRVLYSSGQDEGRRLYEEILNGTSRIVQEQNTEYDAFTEWDPENQVRVVRVNSQGLYSNGGKNSDLALGVVLSHESFRNGWVDGEDFQKYETERAVRGHMAVATQVALSYGTDVLDEKLKREVELFKATLASGSIRALQTYIAQGYESSKDYWKLLRDGTLINDGKGHLLMEILNDDGTQGWQLVQGSEQEHSVAAGLVHYLGKERALALLGNDPSNIDLYDSQTLKDVLKVSDQEIQLMQRNPSYAMNRLKGMGAAELEKLVGEALMKRAGIRWDAIKRVWEGEGTGIRITDSILPGNAAIRSLGGKEYERFCITSEIVRQEGAYSVWMDGNPGHVGSGNTSILVRKWNLDSGKVVQTYRAEGSWNSVDNSYGQKDWNGNPIGVHQPYQLVGGPLVQGNTLAAGALNLRWAQNDSRNFKEVLIMSDTKTISGERILSSGFGEDHPAEGKWLVHYTGYGTSDGCIVSVGEESMKKLMTALKAMGATRGYVISSRLEDRNRFVQGPGYKKGNW